MSYSKGIMWLDDCRIPFVDEGDKKNAVPFGDMTDVKIYGRNSYNESKTIFNTEQNTQGRFTPNLLVCDDMLNDGSVGKTLKSNGANRTKTQTIYGGGKGFPIINKGNNGDKGTNSRYYDLDLWFDKMLEML